ncbi:hypothetical protein QYP02_31685 [Pseudomonas aeruginosa]|nr:hypothetical protein [Pseudomonas aeruginosa]
MRESYRMERYAQRAVRIRRDKEAEDLASRKIGDFLMRNYLAEGALLAEEFGRVSYHERLQLIANSSELIMSSDCGFHADSDTHSTHIRTVIPR